MKNAHCNYPEPKVVFKLLSKPVQLNLIYDRMRPILTFDSCHLKKKSQTDHLPEQLVLNTPTIKLLPDWLSSTLLAFIIPALQLSHTYGPSYCKAISIFLFDMVKL